MHEFEFIDLYLRELESTIKRISREDIGRVINLFCEIEIRQDSKKTRILDDHILIGDNSKLCRIGWRPQIPIEKTLSDVLDYWREKRLD
jgi:nucleoside-diphosphate-sugar epimerase